MITCNSPAPKLLKRAYIFYRVNSFINYYYYHYHTLCCRLLNMYSSFTGNKIVMVDPDDSGVPNDRPMTYYSLKKKKIILKMYKPMSLKYTISFIAHLLKYYYEHNYFMNIALDNILC